MHRNAWRRGGGIVVLLAAFAAATLHGSAEPPRPETYDDLLRQFADWRAFEKAATIGGAPDYTRASMLRRSRELDAWRSRIRAMDTSGWAVEQRIDRELLLAEMNGFEFDERVLRPWERDPAFYATIRSSLPDTPTYEGPTAHGMVGLWTYTFPLAQADEVKLAAELSPIPSFLAQARANLSGNARDLWVTGIGTMREQAQDLAALEAKVAGAGGEVRSAVTAARTATESFVKWLEEQAPKKTGPSGIGKENYTWSQRRVHLLPMTWEDEVALLKRELARAHASLELEEERNRGLPELTAAADDAEFQKRADRAIRKFVSFLGERELYPMRAFMEPELRQRRGAFVPLETRNFFAIATHYEPLTLYTHTTHFWDLARMREEPHPSPVRRGALLYNIWDGRSEGMATAMEELMLHAGLFDDEPRAREIVWVMLAQRAARGLASLYLQANELDLEQAKAFQVEWTPRGWMRPDLDLLNFEQQLYLRQPGYGTSYITGKIQLEDLIRERARQLGKEFTLQRWFDEVYSAGVIPVSLVRWQLTGKDDEIRALRTGR
jgi:hypothetical protein